MGESKRPFEVAPQRNYSFGEMKHFPREKEQEERESECSEGSGVAAFFNANKIAAFRPRAWYQINASTDVMKTLFSSLEKFFSWKEPKLKPSPSTNVVKNLKCPHSL